jgi:hypothetical protein
VIQAKVNELIAGIYGQREEILRAFIAKYGFEPDRAVQVVDGTKWYVRRMTDEEIAVRDARYREWQDEIARGMEMSKAKVEQMTVEQVRERVRRNVASLGEQNKP